MKGELQHAIAGAIALATGLSAPDVEKTIEKPKNSEFGDLAFPCFQLAKKWKLAPNQCAERLSAELLLPQGFQEAVAVGPFLNFRFERRDYTTSILQRILGHSEYVEKDKNSRNTVVIEYSSPNIAKPFHVGHLRTTLIGNALDRLYRYLGYNVVSINHLGDWGTQFGFVWAGCKLWGKPDDPTVKELVELYRRATSLKGKQEQGQLSEEEATYPDVNELARNYFLDLEGGERYAVQFWQWCLQISMVYLKAVYQRLNVHFDHYLGESFYSDKLKVVEHDLRNSGILVESQGALGVDLGEELGFARLFTPDGRSLYLTRDIASAEYRAETFHFDKALYIVGSPQTLHFQHLKGVLKAWGHDYADNVVHVPFGHVIGMKTRGEGGAIELNEFLDEAHDRALKAYREQVSKRPDGLDENSVAEGVAHGAILFSTLSRLRMKDVTFSWDHELAFQGDTGPYLLYACARINGIKEKALAAGIELTTDIHAEHLSEDSAFFLVSTLSDFEEILQRTAEENEPSFLASYLLDLAKAFSKAYVELKVVGTTQETAQARLGLFEATRLTLGKGLELLGITPLERM